MKRALSASDIVFRAGAATLLDRVSVAVEGGETVALVGPNGAGKSTLLKTLSGELTPERGEVVIKGRRVGEYDPRELAAHRVVLAQTITLTFPFTVEEVVRMGAGDRRTADLARRVDEALHAVGLDAYRNRIMTTLSGGEQQRAHFARVLLQLAYGEAERGPGILLLDEPTASLDLRHQIDLLTLARERAAQGTAVVAVLHDLNLATLFASRIVMLDRGRVVTDGRAVDTITDEWLARVFKVSHAVGRVPPPGTPFVLPHSMTGSSAADPGPAIF
jgi:iron complex transport system ATP-binding protein